MHTNPKTNRVGFIIDFSHLNRQLNNSTYPIPKINEIKKLEGFKCATILDSNMGYYRIRLGKNVNIFCTILIPWGKYWHK